MKTLGGTDCKIMGGKFAGFSVSPFLCIKIVHAFFSFG